MTRSDGSVDPWMERADALIRTHGSDALGYCRHEERERVEKGAELAACWWGVMADHVEIRLKGGKA